MTSPAEDEIVLSVFDVREGWCAVAQTEAGVCGVLLPVATQTLAEEIMRGRFPHARISLRGMGDLVKRMQAYFLGHKGGFDDIPLDLSQGTPFQRRAWSATRGIPYGAVRTYGRLASEIGRPRSARAVGGALSANPVPLIVPCHRVVNADGLIGGFSAVGGPAAKVRMLEIEGIAIVDRDGKRRVAADLD